MWMCMSHVEDMSCTACVLTYTHMYTHTEHGCAAVMCDMISTYVRMYMYFTSTLQYAQMLSMH